MDDEDEDANAGDSDDSDEADEEGAHRSTAIDVEMARVGGGSSSGGSNALDTSALHASTSTLKLKPKPKPASTATTSRHHLTSSAVAGSAGGASHALDAFEDELPDEFDDLFEDDQHGGGGGEDTASSTARVRAASRHDLARTFPFSFQSSLMYTYVCAHSLAPQRPSLSGLLGFHGGGGGGGAVAAPAPSSIRIKIQSTPSASTSSPPSTMAVAPARGVLPGFSLLRAPQ